MDERLKRIRRAAEKYRWVLAALALGTALMLLAPLGGPKPQTAEAGGAPAGVGGEMESLLSACEGAGRLRLMLTTEPGSERWAGAVVVCEGADSAAVRLELTRAVSALTGLPTDKIAIMKGNP